MLNFEGLEDSNSTMNLIEEKLKYDTFYKEAGS